MDCTGFRDHAVSNQIAGFQVATIAMETLILYASLSRVFRSGVPQPGANRRPPSGMMRGRIPTGGRPPYRIPTGEGVELSETYLCA